MVHQATLHGGDAKAVRDTRVLIDCLQELVRGAYRPVRNCAKYPEVVWLGDIPDGVLPAPAGTGQQVLVAQHRPASESPALPALLRDRVSATAAATAGAEPPPLTDPASDGDQPDISSIEHAEITSGSDERGDSAALKAYASWTARWKRWAQQELAAEPYRQLHQQLYRMAKAVQQDGDAYEVVLAVGLVQLGAERPSARVRRHLVTTPVTLTIDPKTVNVTVILRAGEGGRLEDTDFLSESDGYTSELLGVVRADVDDPAFHPLSDGGTEAIRAWSQRAFGVERIVPFHPGMEHPDLVADPHIRALHHAPALILREHGQRSVLGFYETIARSLKRPGAHSPLGLAQLLYNLEPPQRTAWGSGGRPVPPALGPDPLFPKVTNAAQRNVLDRLQRDTSVVVQGPPGTGKTHTISNLIAALLADGKRVLVTSAKGQALQVLRDQLPPKMRSLCVLQRDQWQDGSTDLQQSLAALAHLHATTSPDQLQQRIESNEVLRRRLMSEQAALHDSLRAVREIEWYEHAEVSPGYRGRLDDIVRDVQLGAAEHEWLTQLPAHPEQLPPLDSDEARRLVLLVTQHGPGILDSRVHYCPDPASMPAPEVVGHKIRALRQAESALGTEPVSSLARQLVDGGHDRLGELETVVMRAQRALQSVGLSADPTTWEEGEWSTRALRDGIASRWQSNWDSIRKASERARMTQDAIASDAFLDVDVPQLSESQEQQHLSAGRKLEQHVLRNGAIGRRWPKPAIVKEARFLLERCRVEGMAPRTPEQIASLVRHLEMRAHARILRQRWAGVGSSPGQESTDLVTSELLDRVAVLEAIDTCAEAIRELHRTLLTWGMQFPVTTADQWQTVCGAVAQGRLLLQIREAEEHLDGELSGLPPGSSRGVQELQRVIAAAAARDPQAYAAAVEGLAAAYQREADRRETSKLFQRLGEAHPELAASFAEEPLAPHWRSRFASLPQAWAWRQAQAFLDTHLLPGREQQLEGELSLAESRLNDVVESLVCDRAAHHCLTRMTTKHKQALSAYSSAVANAGQGMTVYGKRHLRHARSAMKDAQGAVPAWIMPLRQVAETIIPEPDSFDVVIVDEASQVGLDGLLLLWLAPRIIVVGDDRQCAPFYSGSKHDRITQIFDERLAELIPWQREGFDPKSNLYDLLSSRFTDVIRLTEHFRCMPEIIKWSSTQFYPDNELVLLRQHGADRLPPLQVVHIAEGYCESRRERLINRPEAEAVVAQLLRLTEDPDYHDRTMGVIVLRQQGAHTKLLQDLVDVQIDPAARERHNIRVGTPEQFQGDQRDVILLSMVIDADNARAVTGRNDQRRFNVAASRARDQMWLFHSVTADQLSSKDLRRSLLTYMQNPPPPYTSRHQLGNVTPDEPCTPFQSLFEQRVFLKIKEHGYHVVPQWEISGKVIDLVIIGDHARLAVECDGSPYHSSLQQIHDDAERERDLRRAGWTFWRVRSSSFALSPEDALAPLWDKLTAMGIHPHGTPVTAEGDELPRPSWIPVGLADEEPDDEELASYEGEPDDDSEDA
jgi:very-short-patch-repair endonuclease